MIQEGTELAVADNSGARRVACFQEAAAAGQFLRRELDRDREAMVLFKGSRGMALEKAIAEFSHE